MNNNIYIKLAKPLQIHNFQFGVVLATTLPNIELILISNRLYQISNLTFHFLLLIWSIINTASSLYISLLIWYNRKDQEKLIKIYPYLLLLTLSTLGSIISLYGNINLAVIEYIPDIFLPQFIFLWLISSIFIMPIVSILLNILHPNQSIIFFIIFITSLIFYTFHVYITVKSLILFAVLVIPTIAIMIFVPINIEKDFHHIYEIYENSTVLISLFIGLLIPELIFKLFNNYKVDYFISPWFITSVLSITILLFPIIARMSPIGKTSPTNPLVTSLDKIFVIILLWDFILITINYPITWKNLLTALVTFIGGSLIFYKMEYKYINTYFFEFILVTFSYTLIVLSVLYLSQLLFTNPVENHTPYSSEVNDLFKSYTQRLFAINIKIKTNTHSENIRTLFLSEDRKEFVVIKSPIQIKLSGGIYNLVIYPPPRILNIKTEIKDCTPLIDNYIDNYYQYDTMANGSSFIIYLKNKNNNKLCTLIFRYDNNISNITSIDLKQIIIPVSNAKALLFSQRNVLLINNPLNTIYNLHLYTRYSKNLTSQVSAIKFPKKQEIIFNNEGYFLTKQGLICLNQDFLSKSNNAHNIICLDFQKSLKELQLTESDISSIQKQLASIPKIINLKGKTYTLEAATVKDCKDDNTQDYCKVYPFKPFNNLFIVKEIPTSSRTKNN